MLVAPGGLGCEVADLRQCAPGALTWPASAATGSTTDEQPTPVRDRHHRKRHRPTGSVARRRACLSSSMSWSSALAGRVGTPRCPRRHFTGHRVVAVQRGYGLRDKLARTSARFARVVGVWASVKLKRHGFDCGPPDTRGPAQNAATSWPQFSQASQRSIYTVVDRRPEGNGG